jgi:DNA-binding response OmpR family regulator
MSIQRSFHILIVDPDAVAAHVTRAVVARAAPDAILTIEPDAEQARRSLSGIKPDVLIIDPSPSLLAGKLVISAMKAQPSAGQIIVIASAPTAGLRRHMRDLGVDLYLEKPAPLMVADLRQLIEHSRQARQAHA